MDELKFYVDRLAEGKEERLTLDLAPDFISVSEEELKFCDTVTVSLRVYVASDDLIIHFSLETQVTQACAICNEMFSHKLLIDDSCYTKSLSSIRGRVYDSSNCLREAILLELSSVVECCDGHCPERKYVEKYLTLSGTGNGEEVDGVQPFKDLDFPLN